MLTTLVNAKIAAFWMSSQLCIGSSSMAMMRSPSLIPKRASAESGGTYPMMVWLRATGSPITQRTEPNPKARTTFMNGPARATRILWIGRIGGKPVPERPSIISEVTIWGSFTKPPAGIQRMAHSTP